MKEHKLIIKGNVREVQDIFARLNEKFKGKTVKEVCEFYRKEVLVLGI
jgi:hypothetical protein